MINNLTSKHANPDENMMKTYYMDAVNEIASVPLDSSPLVVHAVASYFARYYINKKQTSPEENISEEGIRELFGMLLSRLNESVIIDINLILKKIKDYVRYYNTITYHEFIIDNDKVTKESIETLNLTESEVNQYFYNGLNMVMGLYDYKVILKNYATYRKLSATFNYGIKYIQYLIEDDDTYTYDKTQKSITTNEG